MKILSIAPVLLIFSATIGYSSNEQPSENVEVFFENLDQEVREFNDRVHNLMEQDTDLSHYDLIEKAYKAGDISLTGEELAYYFFLGDIFGKVVDVGKKIIDVGKGIVGAIKDVAVKVGKTVINVVGVVAKKGLEITKKGFSIAKSVAGSAAKVLSSVLSVIPPETMQKLANVMGNVTEAAAPWVGKVIGGAIGAVVGEGVGAIPGEKIGGMVSTVLGHLLGAGMKAAPSVLQAVSSIAAQTAAEKASAS